MVLVLVVVVLHIMNCSGRSVISVSIRSSSNVNTSTSTCISSRSSECSGRHCFSTSGSCVSRSVSGVLPLMVVVVVVILIVAVAPVDAAAVLKAYFEGLVVYQQPVFCGFR